MRIIVPPIKSQGIKTKLVPWIQALVPAVSGRWIEPFLGTGVVAFNSGFQKALLGDINPHIINFYQGIKDRTITPASVRTFLEAEGRLLENADDRGYTHFRAVKDRFNRNFHPLDFLFLSRAGFNGMMRFNRKGEWNIPFCQKPERFAPAYITKIVNQVHDVACLIRPEWSLRASSFEELIKEAAADDFIYCDPPYIGRYVDYYSGWTEDSEKKLHALLSASPARFILSTWHHNDYRTNRFVETLWKEFNVVTRDHFYHSGGKIENRRSIVEALVFNFEADVEEHNHGVIPKQEQLMLFDERTEYITQQESARDHFSHFSSFLSIAEPKIEKQIAGVTGRNNKPSTHRATTNLSLDIQRLTMILFNCMHLHPHFQSLQHPRNFSASTCL